MKALRLSEPYTQYTVTRNKYGDEILTQIGAGVCLFRNISMLERNINFAEDINVQGIFWFSATDPKLKGDVIGYGSMLYRLEDVIVAKQLVSTNNIHFYKCHASLLRQIS